MADIFISYSKVRQPLAAELAQDLAELGYTVWWDTSLLPTGSFGEAIDRELDAASAVIVIWSAEAAKSKWVRSEASHADRQHKLINTHAAEITPHLHIPKPFDQTHSVAVADLRAIVGALDALKVPRSAARQPVAEQAPARAGGAGDADDALFAEAERRNTLEAYRYYLEELPEGRHRLVVKLRIKDLEAARDVDDAKLPAETLFDRARAHDTGKGAPQDDKEAVRLYRLAADKAHARAQNNLGWMYANGRGVPQDDGEAVRLYRLAADQGDAGGQTNLGVMYANGCGVPQDDTEAVRLYGLAADQGHSPAQFNLGFTYMTGRGVPQDHKEAVRLYRLAGDQGDAHAHFYLGVMYEDGRGVPQDDQEAARLYRLAADQGHARAQFSLADKHEFGKGVTKDLAEAKRLYRLAAAQGSEAAKQALGRLGEKL